METFKENTYYPVGTQLIYKDKIIEVQNFWGCEGCAFAGGCSGTTRHRCHNTNRPDDRRVQYVVIGDAPAKGILTRNIGEKFEHSDNKWYEVIKAEHKYACPYCAFYGYPCTCGSCCAEAGYKYFAEIPAPKHDKPVVEGLQHLKNRQSEVYLETVAINEQVNIAVEPITRQKTILDRINEELHIWVDTYIMGGRNIRVILLSSKAYEEYITLVPKKYWDEVDLLGDKRKQYLSVKVRRCPDVIDVELH